MGFGRAVGRVAGRRIAGFAAAVFATVLANAVRAEDYPTRTVKIIVPTGPSGSYDVVARIVGEPLSKRLGQGVVVENRTGAGTVVGTQSAVASPPDGYTLVIGGLSNIVFNSALYKKTPYDPLTQLVPVAIVYKFAYVLVAPMDFPFTPMKELIARAKKNPEELRLAHPGIGSGQQLVGTAFMKYTGTKLLEVPYRSSSAVYPDLISGRVELFFDSATAAIPYVKGKQVKGLAVLASQRLKDAPDVPTMAEEGVQGLDIDSWIGLFAPANTPKPVIERLQKEIAGAGPELKSRFVAVGGDLMTIEPSRLNGFIRAEHDKWTKIIKDAGITLD
jgi:tripartite-type tricarboxylate transporter receptor subunit TctC